MALEQWSGQSEADFGQDARRRQRWEAAYRHSRFVRWLRVGLPLLSLLIVAGILVSLRSLPGGGDEVAVDGLGGSDSSLTMESPSLTGHGSGGMTYKVSAVRAHQEIDTPNVVELETIDGRVDEDDGGWTRLTAVRGTYDSEKESLRLNENIRVVTHDGTRAFLDDAEIDFNARSIFSDKPVRLETDSSRVTADRMEVSDGGEHIVLKGRVRVELRLDGGRLEENSDAW